MSFDPASVVRDYGDPFAEASACRASCALFDYSFIARARVAGPSAIAAMGAITARRLDDMGPGQIRYAVRTDASGHLVADLTIWRHSDGAFELMSGRPSDIADLAERAATGAVTDLSRDGAIFAVQGPDALRVLRAAGFDDPELELLRYYRFVAAGFGSVPCLVGRLGYTGESGFEIVVPLAHAAALWSRLSALARPAGFAAADILRIEAGFVLFANEFRIPVTATEAGVAGFDGARSDPLPAVALVAFTAHSATRPVLWQPPPDVRRPGRSGEIAVTSACWSPAANGILGLGYVRRDDAGLGGAPAERLVDPHGNFFDIALAPRPFVDPGKLRPRAPWSRST